MTLTIGATCWNASKFIRILLWGLAVSIPAHSLAEDVQEFNDYAGVVGDAPIGMTLSLSEDKVRKGSHYYYRKYLKDIPLTGTIDTELRFVEPGGGVFLLHYVDNKLVPVTAENSTGLIGTWSGNGHTVPVKLVSVDSSSYRVGHRYEDVTNKDDSQFEEPIKKFYDAVINGRPSDAVQFVAFPLRVNVGARKFIMINSASELQQRWNIVFPPAWLEALKKFSPHDLFTRNGQAMIGAGLAYFGDDGLEIVNAIP
ncbi:hypothetical protein [Gluconobacter frateurii]|uniref:Uncharacterized protein n=1 Tax=Gluconobacter frateurii NRIC 0228 TaxID=1307946 RepID=A0ABQ0QCD6_9PROT|nr:hypothetical protein [Gluconobacter frateurii]GBR13067.1 hypothetical protein AA0228_1910 [Gluconobacter frateurii NRIC 0228]GLP89900.1 hypothetical protein GCM10007868_09750 [Gluconobacter frateurii]